MFVFDAGAGTRRGRATRWTARPTPPTECRSRAAFCPSPCRPRAPPLPSTFRFDVEKEKKQKFAVITRQVCLVLEAQTTKPRSHISATRPVHLSKKRYKKERLFFFPSTFYDDNRRQSKQQLRGCRFWVNYSSKWQQQHTTKDGLLNTITPNKKQQACHEN